jgi:hypothetical protein
MARALVASLLIGAAVGACTPPQVQQGQIEVSVTVDGEARTVSLPAGATAREALEAVGVEVGLLDRSEPPFYTVLSDRATVRLIRVQEEFLIEEMVIPYETQILRNESLPEGERRLIQPGVNGLQEVTYRRVFEDGVEVSNSQVKIVVVEEPQAEVLMVGSQAPFAAQTIPGRLAYISGGNAWVMEQNSGNRRPVVTTGDLDGHIFSLSQDGVWLLYTRSDPDEEVINTLWIARVDDDSGQTIDLKTSNVIHFASWIPGSSNGVAVSTVEPSPTAPGWQANNDLLTMTFSDNGWVSLAKTIIEPSTGGLYGWWGTNFVWSPDGELLAYTRPDSVGIVDFEAGEFVPLLQITPFQTNSEWAWMPGLSWGPDGKFLFTVEHAPQEGVISPEESPLFDLAAVPLDGAPISLLPQVGMFAYPVTSPLQTLVSGEQFYQVAFLQALSPRQSRDSKYQLAVMDRDGSNRRVIFPPEGAPGLDPQRLAWSPVADESTGGFLIAFIYQGNLWLVDVVSGQVQQLTGDGLVTAMDWR